MINLKTEKLVEGFREFRDSKLGSPESPDSSYHWNFSESWRHYLDYERFEIPIVIRDDSNSMKVTSAQYGQYGMFTQILIGMVYATDLYECIIYVIIFIYR